ncbi:transcriptional regulator [Streptomyces sp. FT05W]|uniref:Transcriptional regulator n=1 Tax=Streptomyces parvus TaxID=66428 RepID=A0A5D4JMV0_9ACTN|nr:transcriptional regulator [Streptomyces silvae]MBT2394705.1 transcriptional regulator [Streptomyces sp. ISL-100]PWS51083.1 transcriptional regulator [Streptomyces sp. FT05W]TYR65709.1 transcriptional regulator [Streptomyces parvus]
MEIPSGPAERLAAQLSSMLPEAAVVQVRLQGPRTLWPHLGLTAVNARGRTLRVPRAKALTIARWIIRSFPQAGWAASGGHAFDLRTAELRGLEA